MTETMTIQDAMDELKLIMKKIHRNNADLKVFSSKRKGTEDKIEKQQEFVTGLIDSNRDLFNRWKTIKLAIMQSNLVTAFEFNGQSYSIAEALLLKQGLLDEMVQSTNSLTEQTAQNDINQLRSTILRGDITSEQMEKLDLVPKLFYNEAVKRKKLDEYLELRSYIDRLIDKSNHNTIITI